MSNFITFGKTSDGIQGTASSRYSASTADSLATITATGYMNDKSHIVKVNDVVEINYNDTTVLPGQIVATYGQFQVVSASTNLNLISLGSDSIGVFNVINAPVAFSDLTGGQFKTLIQPLNSTTSQFQITGMYLNAPGTNFAGAGANRNLSITDGTTVYSIIPAATLQALTNSAWGSTALPFPASAAIDTKTAAGLPLLATYSGGTTDYTSGALVLSINYVRVA